MLSPASIDNVLSALEKIEIVSGNSLAKKLYQFQEYILHNW